MSSSVLTSPPRSKANRLFFALLPDAEAGARLGLLAEGLKRAHGFTGRLIRREHLHVSLIYLGSWDEMPDRVIQRACAGAEQVAALPFRVTFDRAASFQGREGNYPFVLLSDDQPLWALRGSLAAALTREKLGTLVRGSFAPHMTLLYDRRIAEEGPIMPIGWTAREIVLVHSLFGRNAYNALARWRLGDG